MSICIYYIIYIPFKLINISLYEKEIARLAISGVGHVERLFVVPIIWLDPLTPR